MDERHERLKAKSIQKAELKHLAWYRGICRNATIAQWNKTNNKFWYTRHKFGDTFTESINHPEDDNGFDLFYPFELLQDK